MYYVYGSVRAIATYRVYDEEECEVDGNSVTMMQVISECKDDAVIKSPSKGPAVLELLDCQMHRD